MGDFRRDTRGERCWQCGAAVRPGAAECRNCGAQLVSDTDESTYLPARRPERPEPRRRSSGTDGNRQSRYDDADRYAGEDDEYDDRADRASGRSGSRGGRDDRADRTNRADPRRPRPGDDDRRSRDSRNERSRRDDRSNRGDRGDRGRRYAEPVYDESVEAPALDPSAEYPAYADDSREEPAYSDDSREDYAYRDNRKERSERGSHDGRRGPGGRDDFADEPTLRPGRGESRAGRSSRSDANQPDPFDDPRAPSAFRTSRSRPLSERDAYPADPRRNARSPQPSRSRSRSGAGYDEYPAGDPRMGGMGGGRGSQGGRSMAPGADPRMGGMGGGRSMGGLHGPMGPQGMNSGPGGLMPPIPGGLGMGGPMDAPAKPAQKRRRTPGIVIGVIAALLLIAIVVSILFIPKIRRHIPGLNGGGSSSSPGVSSTFATYTPGPTPTVLANDKQFSSAQSQYILNYPASWKVANNSNAAGGQYDNYDSFAPTSDIPSIGVEQAGQFSASSDQQIIQSEVDSVKAAATQNHQTETITQIGSDVPQTVGGETWQRAEYTIVSGSVTLHMSLLACHHNGKGYAIVLLDTANNFQADDQNIFAPTLKSFRFS